MTKIKMKGFTTFNDMQIQLLQLTNCQQHYTQKNDGNSQTPVGSGPYSCPRFGKQFSLQTALWCHITYNMNCQTLRDSNKGQSEASSRDYKQIQPTKPTQESNECQICSKTFIDEGLEGTWRDPHPTYK